ncbi:MAG: hypothetical protein Q9165_001065 [Trypethelium subeluteriae]
MAPLSSKEADATLNRSNLSVGAAIPKEFAEDSLEQKPRTRDEQLRRQLLAKRDLAHTKAALNGTSTGLKRSQIADDNEDDEGGRASAFRPKKYKAFAGLDREQERNRKITSLEREAPMPMMNSTEVGDEYGSNDESASKTDDASQRESKKPLKNYLDQVLAQKAEKQKRKRTKKKANSRLQRQTP